MKKIYNIFALLLMAVLAYSCQSDDLEENVGYLRMDIETVTMTNPQTRIAADYNPKQLAVQVLNAAGTVVEETDDYTTWSSKQLRLAPGTYTVTASSNGFDGSESGFDIPYYVGSTQVTITAGKEVTASITCTLANVKVSVNFDDTFKAAFKSATATVSSALSGVSSQVFTMGTTQGSAYFPVANLTSTISVVNNADETHSSSYTITGVEARDHIILNYKVAETGTAGGVTVTVDGTETIYTFTFNVSTEARTSLAMKNVNAWGTFAYVTGNVSALEDGKTLDATKMNFEYKTSSADTWTTVAATQSGDDYTATLSGLTAETSYQCRMSYQDGNDSYTSAATTFTTEATPTLVNGSFDDWYKSGNTWYAASEAYYTANGSFWDSSNPGTTIGAGAMVNVNPTQGNSTIVHTAGGMSAELVSQYASAFGFGKFAAASLYTGSFGELVGTNGAKINFGQPFTSRPSQLHGYFRYTSGTIDYRGSNTPDGVATTGSNDLCSIYFALTTEQLTVDNTKTSSFINWDTNEAVIAYGELPESEAVTTDGWKEFTINLNYHNLTTKPSYIIIVCSSSKYGDYFTGSTSSVMYLDDFELVYGEPVSE